MAALAPPPIDRFLPAFLDDLGSTLRGELVGAYLYGSAVSGGFDAAASDLDVVVVTETPVDAQPFERFAGIVERLQAREPDWAGRLDIIFIGRSTLADFRQGGGPFLEISHDEPLELKRRADDWLQTWYLVRIADRALVGPSPSTLIPLITTGEFLRATVDGADSFIAPDDSKGTDGWRAYRTLTLCRLLASLDAGELRSKVEGAAWATERYPEWSALIDAALEVRARGGVDGFSQAQREAVPALLAFLASEVSHRASADMPR